MRRGVEIVQPTVNRKTWGIILLLVAAVAVPMYRLTDWFSPKAIQVSVSFRPLRQAEPGAALPVVVGLDQDYELSSLVVSEVQPEKSPSSGHVVWHLEKQGKGAFSFHFFHLNSISSSQRNVCSPSPCRTK